MYGLLRRLFGRSEGHRDLLSGCSCGLDHGLQIGGLGTSSVPSTQGGVRGLAIGWESWSIRSIRALLRVFWRLQLFENELCRRPSLIPEQLDVVSGARMEALLLEVVQDGIRGVAALELSSHGCDIRDLSARLHRAIVALREFLNFPKSFPLLLIGKLLR